MRSPACLEARLDFVRDDSCVEKRKELVGGFLSCGVAAGVAAGVKLRVKVQGEGAG